MDIFESLVPLGIVLVCLAGVAALIALAYLLVGMAKTLKETMAKVEPLIDEAQGAMEAVKPAIARIEPLMDGVEQSLEAANDAIAAVKPALDRIDPLMERVTLSVDAANLEIMRVDQILEDVNTITGNISKATESIDSIASLPFDALSSVTGRLRGRLQPLGYHSNERVSQVANAVDQTLECVEGKVTVAQAKADVKRAERDEVIAAREASQQQANQMSSDLKDAFADRIDADTAR